MSVLNPYQRRRIVTTCEYVDKLLAEAEHILICERPPSPVQGVRADVPPRQIEKVKEACAQLRQAMQQLLSTLGIEQTLAGQSARAIFHTALVFAGIAFEELRPRYLRGYGELPEDVASKIEECVSSMKAMVDRMIEECAAGAYLPGRDEAAHAIGTSTTATETQRHS